MGFPYTARAIDRLHAVRAGPRQKLVQRFQKPLASGKMRISRLRKRGKRSRSRSFNLRSWHDPIPGLGDAGSLITGVSTSDAAAQDTEATEVF
jgi:hypothetical protein